MFLKELLSRCLSSLAARLDEDDGRIVWKEVQDLEAVPPAPNRCVMRNIVVRIAIFVHGYILTVELSSKRPGAQHDTMVSLGLCKEACKHPRRHRYCNQVPLDRNLVRGVPGVDYINASDMRLPGWDQEVVITGGPMHPRDYSSRSTPSDFAEGPDGVPDTCPDFWRMVAHRRAAAVVMLCTVQRGFTGCSEYFPGEKGDVKKFASDLQVICVGEIIEIIFYQSRKRSYSCLYCTVLLQM